MRNASDKIGILKIQSHFKILDRSHRTFQAFYALSSFGHGFSDLDEVRSLKCRIGKTNCKLIHCHPMIFGFSASVLKATETAVIIDESIHKNSFQPRVLLLPYIIIFPPKATCTSSRCLLLPDAQTILILLRWGSLLLHTLLFYRQSCTQNLMEVMPTQTEFLLSMN